MQPLSICRVSSTYIVSLRYYLGLRIKCLLLLSDFNQNQHASPILGINSLHTKICSAGAEMLHSSIWTCVKLPFAFHKLISKLLKA